MYRAWGYLPNEISSIIIPEDASVNPIDFTCRLWYNLPKGGMTMSTVEQQIERVVDSILGDYSQGRDIDKIDLLRHPDKEVIIDMIQKLMRIVYPG